MNKTIQDRISAAEAAIEAIPREYRSLVQTEKTWALKHPVYYAGALLLAGAFVGVTLSYFL